MLIQFSKETSHPVISMTERYECIHFDIFPLLFEHANFMGFFFLDYCLNSCVCLFLSYISIYSGLAWFILNMKQNNAFSCIVTCVDIFDEQSDIRQGHLSQ